MEALATQFKNWLNRTPLAERKIFYQWLTTYRPTKSEISPALTQQLTELPESVVQDWLVYRLDSLFWRAKLEIEMKSFDISAFQTWQRNLSAKELRHLYQSLNRFCQEIGIDLEWLLDEAVRLTDPEVKAIKEAVFLHSLAFWRAKQVQNYIYELNQFQEWQARLTDEEYKQFNEIVFHKLAQRGLISPPPSNLWSSAEVKQAYLAQIDEIMTRYSQTMQDIIKQSWQSLAQRDQNE